MNSFSLAPIINRGAFRAVLNWSSVVKDLDLYSFFRVNNFINCNVFFGNRKCVETNLVTDNSNYGSKGGETISVESFGNFMYTFAVRIF